MRVWGFRFDKSIRYSYPTDYILHSYMTKIITTTFLLKNPAKVREMVKKGIELLVKFEGEIVMKISIPQPKSKGLLPPVFKSVVQTKSTFSREEIYDTKY
jgi:hypothetical protein